MNVRLEVNVICYHLCLFQPHYDASTLKRTRSFGSAAAFEVIKAQHRLLLSQSSVHISSGSSIDEI
eukprot:scaffold3640_cov201-Alexandrium_tamarense.AAC.12